MKEAVDQGPPYARIGRAPARQSTRNQIEPKARHGRLRGRHPHEKRTRQDQLMDEVGSAPRRVSAQSVEVPESFWFKARSIRPQRATSRPVLDQRSESSQRPASNEDQARAIRYWSRCGNAFRPCATPARPIARSRVRSCRHGSPTGRPRRRRRPCRGRSR